MPNLTFQRTQTNQVQWANARNDDVAIAYLPQGLGAIVDADTADGKAHDPGVRQLWDMHRHPVGLCSITAIMRRKVFFIVGITKRGGGVAAKSFAA